MAEKEVSNPIKDGDVEATQAHIRKLRDQLNEYISDCIGAHHDEVLEAATGLTGCQINDWAHQVQAKLVAVLNQEMQQSVHIGQLQLSIPAMMVASVVLTSLTDNVEEIQGNKPN